ncbi:MAG TPA: hypothetical protein VFJ02_07950 [Vicinamibacterales bacterium]|nr:hypothetical protein [Vicinamibacterales bacterium]
MSRPPPRPVAHVLVAIVACCGAAILARQQPSAGLRDARERGQRFERAVAAMQRVLDAWLERADRRTLLLPDRLPGLGSGLKPGDPSRLYTPHNSGADLYPYLILTSELTAPDLYRGRMLEMLRNEVQFTNTTWGIPGNLDLNTGTLGEPSMFGAGEYAKDGLLTVTEYLGRTPWYYRMVDMVAAAMEHAPVESRFGRLPASDSELNGDYLQVLARLGTMTGDHRFVEWARRIADAYIEEVIPGSHGVPSGKWDFTAHTGDQHLRFRDHGNEIIVGLLLQYANEQRWETPRAQRWRPVIARMLDRVLESANADGLLYDEVDTATLAPFTRTLSDNWGYVYGAVYTFYQCSGESRYRDAVLKVLRNLPKYRRHVWEPRPRDPELPLGSFDGYADTIESALYLVAREPVPEALEWIESEMQIMLSMQKRDGHIEYWYGEGNFNRTAMLYALMQSAGVRPAQWQPGMRVGAVKDGPRLHLSLAVPSPTLVRFDFARHRRVLNLDRNYVRLNEFPEWFTVDENTLYRVSDASDARRDTVYLGSELIRGVTLGSGDYTIEPR